MRYRIGAPRFGKFFTVPCGAVENYIKTADSNFFKVLLCALCSNDDIADTEVLAGQCRLTAAQTEDALLFWADKGVIMIESVGGEAVPAAVSVPAAVPEDQKSAEVPKVPEKKKTARAILRVDNKEILRRRENEPKVAWLLDNIQNVFGKPPNSFEITTLLKIYDLYKFDVPTILIIAQYVQDNFNTAAKIGKMETLADEWFVDNVTSYEQIEADIERRMKYNTIFEKFKRSLEMDCSLTKKQEMMFTGWVDWGFNEHMVALAYERCRESKGERNLGYINGILRKWQEKKIFTVDAANEADEKFRAELAAAPKNNAPKRGNAAAENGGLKSSFDSDSLKELHELALNFDPNLLGFEEDDT